MSNQGRAVIYARISRDPNDESQSPARQIADCRAFAERHGFGVIPDDDIYKDVGRSAWTTRTRRPAFEKLLTDIEEGLVDAIFVWALDRLTRTSEGVAGELLSAIRRHKVRVFSVQEQELTDDSEMGELRFDFALMLAKSESRRRSSRTKSAHKVIAQNGLWSGGIVPVGFKRVEEPDAPGGFKKGYLEHHPIEAPAVRAAYEQLMLGHSMASVTRKFNEATSEVRKQPISPRSLRNVLTSPVTVGRRVHVPEAVGDPWAATKKRRDPNLDLSTASYDAVWDGILDYDEWREICMFFNDPSRDTRRGRPPGGSILAGVLKCTVCKESLGYKAESYQCRNHCNSLSTRLVERYVLGYVQLAIEHTTNMPNVVLTRQQKADGDALLKQRDRIKRDREIARAKWRDHVLTEDEYDEDMRWTKQRLDELDAQIAEVQMPRRGVLPSMEVWNRLIKRVEKAERGSDEAKDANAEVNKVIKKVIDKVWVKKTDRPSGGKFMPDARLEVVVHEQYAETMKGALAR